jgi:hypothetical protein
VPYKPNGYHNKMSAEINRYWVLKPNDDGRGYKGHPNVKVWERYVPTVRGNSKMCKVFDLELREFISADKVAAALQ